MSQPAVSIAEQRAPVVGTAPSSRWRWLGALFRPASLAMLGLIVGSALPLEWLTTGPALCPFKLFTGLPCPGCGLTRSAVALLHGDPSASLFYHPLGGLLVIAAVLIGLVDAWVWWRIRQPDAVPASPFWLLERLVGTPAPWVVVGALIVVWLVRLPLYVAGAWTF